MIYQDWILQCRPGFEVECAAEADGEVLGEGVVRGARAMPLIERVFARQAFREVAALESLPAGDRIGGYTGHEELDNVGLIHMNGRVYDPIIGRFLSVDPDFHFPDNGQSLNPYSYVLNNPLSFTDPTGYDCDGGTDSCVSTTDIGGKSADDVQNVQKMKNGQLVVNFKNGDSYAVSSVASATVNSNGSVTLKASVFNGNGYTNFNATFAVQDRSKDAAGIGSLSEGGKIAVTGTDIVTTSKDSDVEHLDGCLKQSDRQLPQSYGNIVEDALAQFKAYDPEYQESVKAAHPYELTGLPYIQGTRFYFSEMRQLKGTQFDGQLGVLGIDPANIRGYTHTHPDGTIFNGKDYETPEGYAGKYGDQFSFMRNTNNAYQWKSTGAKNYHNYLRYQKKKWKDTIDTPNEWGISSICPGSKPCL